MRDIAIRDLNFSVVNQPGKYLGMVLGNRGKHNDFIPLINKIQGRINSLSNRFLSYAGKTTMINAVISPLITFHANSVTLPVKTCKVIDRTLRDFFWSSNSNKKKIHTLSWEKICLPTSLGGLGIHLTKERNCSLITKLACQVKVNPNCLWSKSVHHYLLRSCNSFSTTGRAIRKGNSVINSHSWALVRNGKGPLNKEDNLITVNQLANDLGSWSWDLISFDLPQSIKDLINATPCLKDSSFEDISSCTFQKNGNFKLSLVYQDLISKHPNDNSLPTSGKWIWHSSCHRRLKFFIWINNYVFNEKTPCPNWIAKRSIATAAEYHHIALSKNSSAIRTPLTVSVKWKPPYIGWWKLNCDGAYQGNPGPFSIGGILRDAHGNWISGYSGFIGDGTALEVKLWAITMGLKVATILNCNLLWIETDSLLAFNLLMDNSISNQHEYWNLINFCRSASQNFSQVNLSHTFREGNQCADQLAMLALLNREAYNVYQDIPSFLKLIFLADLHGVTFDRETSSCNRSLSNSMYPSVCNVVSLSDLFRT
ncbi:reverse transcriptase [Senna tora]|uniref:Reverse transcriptase n=1 Tax=Senna tora TaxID=362788 RepID=A0A834XA70_9FABA|nr:reverse transcriptase [Senna tora]